LFRDQLNPLIEGQTHHTMLGGITRMSQSSPSARTATTASMSRPARVVSGDAPDHSLSMPSLVRCSVRVELGHEPLRRANPPRVLDELLELITAHDVEPDEDIGVAVVVRGGEEGLRLSL
jgi:hypothetical protein